MTVEIDPLQEHTPRFPPIQASPGSKPAKWVNQRELGRLFGISGAQMGQHLMGLGWKTKNAPTAEVLEQGLAKPIVRSKYEAGRVVGKETTGYRWYVPTAVPLLEKSGLAPLSEQDVFAHALADLVSKGVKSARQRGLGMAEELRNWTWFTDRVEQNLALLSPQAVPGFLVSLAQQLEARGISQPHVELFLEVIGRLAQVRAEKLEAALPSEPLAPRARSRF